MLKSELLNIPELKKGTNEYKILEHIILFGRVYNFDFYPVFDPNICSYTKTICRLKEKIERYGFTIPDAKKDSELGNKFYWIVIIIGEDDE